MDNRINSVNRKMNNKIDIFFWLVYTNFIREVRLTLYFKSKGGCYLKKELATQVNAYLANIGVSYIKLHNLHWNVVGSQFKAAHEYLETLYDALADVLECYRRTFKNERRSPFGKYEGLLISCHNSRVGKCRAGCQECDADGSERYGISQNSGLFHCVSRPTRRINLMWLPTWKTMWQITTKQFGSFNLC